MSYFMRFVLTDAAPPSLAEIEAALQAIDPDFLIVQDSSDEESADLMYGDDLFGEIEVNLRGDPLCDEDLEDLADELHKQDDPNREVALQALEQATGLIVVHILRAGHDNFSTLNLLWEWLFTTRQGLLQVDEEGFFDREKRIVSLL